MLEVKKRNGSIVEFDPTKIEKAIANCFGITNKNKNKINHVYKAVFDKLKTLENTDSLTDVEVIQNIIENTMIELGYTYYAKQFIIYREKHKHLREFVQKKKDFINNYEKSANTANATIDDNSNVANKNIAVLNAEIHKEDNQNINYRLLEEEVHKLFPDFDYKQMLKDFNSIAYLHDSSSQIGMPYCVAITMYPFLNNGIKDLGGLSAKPKSLESFCGIFINMVFAIAAQYKGAVATPGFLLCMDWFCRQDFGEDYYLKSDKICCGLNKPRTIKEKIEQYFQQVTYSINQPASARGGQSCFWNISIFDKEFFKTMYGEFKFPDMSEPVWESFNWLQKLYLHWLNQERLKCILTFPVISVALIYKDDKFVDEDLYHYACKEYAEGNSFFTYINDSPESLSSCCRLSSKISKPQFNFTNGQVGEMTGSKNVITLNINRIVQDWFHTIPNYMDHIGLDNKCACPEGFIDFTRMKDYFIEILDRIYKYQTAYNSILVQLYNAGLLTVYNAGFINLKKQYLTIGINGLNQAAEFLGIECNKNKEYQRFCNFIFSTIKEQNTLHKTKDLMFNTEFTPCESASIKMYNRDKKDGYWIPNDTNLYASYIFKPNDKNISVLDKIYLHGKDFCGDNLDGRNFCLLNLFLQLKGYFIMLTVKPKLLYNNMAIPWEKIIYKYFVFLKFFCIFVLKLNNYDYI